MLNPYKKRDVYHDIGEKLEDIRERFNIPPEEIESILKLVREYGE